MASRENWAYDAQTETILASSAVRAVGGTHRLHMEAEFTPLYDSCCIYAETCCVPACPSGIIMVSFCKEVDPCEI